MYPLHLTPGLEASSKADFWPPGLDTSTVRMFRDNLRARRGFRTEADLRVLIRSLRWIQRTTECPSIVACLEIGHTGHL
jgi:hypothetical protein